MTILSLIKSCDSVKISEFKDKKKIQRIDNSFKSKWQFVKIHLNRFIFNFFITDNPLYETKSDRFKKHILKLEANALKKYYIAMDKKAKIYLAVTVQ